MGTSDRRKFIDSFLKMNPTTWITIALAVITLATPGRSSEPRVVCYYTNWSVYRPGTARFNPQNINPYLCTHLVYAFGGFTKDNTLKPFDKYQDIEKGGYAKFTGLKTYNKNLKTMLAIGGWNEGSTRFSPMVAARERRKEFVRNAIKFLRQNRFDGLDLDWEYPAFRDGGKPKDRENYAKLVKELREEFDREAEKTGRPRLLLTMAVPAGIEYIQKGFDVKTLNQYLDWMNLLTYDYHSAFEPAVNHHAPLYPLEEPNEYSVDNELNIDYTIKFYIESGADPDKLVLGIPTYGRSYTLFNADAVEIGSPADGPGEQGDATREKGYLAYYEICEGLKPKEKKRSTSDEDSDEDSVEEDEPWTVMSPNPSAMGPVAYKGNQWVGYDDIAIVKKKAEYVAENGLGGIMFWSIDNDDFRGNCHGKPYPLIEAAKEAYIVKLGSTDNTIVTDRPRSVTTASSSSRRRSRPRSSTTTTTTTAKPSTAPKSNKRKSSSSVTSTTPTWNIVTPEPPTTPDPGSDFKCTDEGFFQHPRDCKKYFWCLDSGPSNLGIVAHQFTCPSGLFFNKAADSCDFSRNVHCKTPSATTKAPTTKADTTSTSTTTRRPVKLSTKSSVLFRTTSTTTAEPEVEEEYEDESLEDTADIDAEDPKVLKELIDLIKKVGGVEQLEKHLHLSDTPASTDGTISTTPSPLKIKLKKVLERTRGKTRLGGNVFQVLAQNSRRGPQNAGLEESSDKDKLLKKDRPQYTTIQRSRASTSTTEEPSSDEESGEDVELEPQQPHKPRAVDAEAKASTTTKPLQYVNIRRARPTSDTADDTASRNALFERPETFVAVSDTPSSLDIASSRRENMPEYVTIKRQRPTTEEATTMQYQSTEQEDETQETALEREISSPSSQPQYTSIVRSRSSTLPPIELSSPEPTTVLAVQISSLLNSPSSSEESLETTVAEATEDDVTTTSTSTTTPAPSSSSAPPRRTVLRRRGSTTTTTPASKTTQAAKRNFPRRTKSTSPPDITGVDTVDTTTTKYTRRGVSGFKSRKESSQKEIANKELRTEDNSDRRRPYLNGDARRSERPSRNFVRRRLGGANATSSSPAPATLPPPNHRPFRVASRRRLGTTSTTPTTTTTTTTTELPTTAQLSEELLQDIGDTDAIEDPTLQERAAPKTPKIQRRPLTSLKDDDQNPSATNEDEQKKQNRTSTSGEEDKKRQSKKYSSSFKQNQLDEVLRQKAKSQEEVDVTTEGKSTRQKDSEEIDVTTIGTTIDDYSAETALAIAAHQLLAAPLPSVPNFDVESKPTKKSIPQTTHEYKYTSPEYTDVYTGKTYSDEYTTPIYKVTEEYIPTSTLEYSVSPSAFNSLKTTTSTYVAPKSSIYPPTAFSSRSRPSGFSTPNVLSTLNPTTSSFTSTRASTLAGDRSTYSGFPRGRNTYTSSLSGVSQSLSPTISSYSEIRGTHLASPTVNAEFSRGRSTYTPVSQNPTISSFSSTARGVDFSSPATINTELSRVQSTSGYSGVSQNFPTSSRLPSSVVVPSTAGYLGSSEKLIPVPVEDYSLTPEGYSTGQEPAYFTREYLLESPVTKTYDDEYQYLSPITTPQTTRKLPKKTVYRKISTTHRPTAPSVTTPKPRRAQPAKPFEKVLKKTEPKRTYKPIENYDYYDDDHEKFADKYEEGTKVVLHAKGNIECLDIGNFPHPTSCKKFISCARLENGSLLGWEYICPEGLSFDPVGGICNWSAGLGCEEKAL